MTTHIVFNLVLLILCVNVERDKSLEKHGGIPRVSACGDVDVKVLREAVK